MPQISLNRCQPNLLPWKDARLSPRCTPVTDDPLAPGLLLASPNLDDPNFEQTVILLGHHDADGALGWVINGTALMQVEELLRSSGLISAAAATTLGPGFFQPARVGGPVDPATGWIVYRHKDFRPENFIELGAGLGVTGDSDALDRVMKGKGPQDFRMLIGYSGWGPGQLESELQQGAWLPAAVDPVLVFDTPSEKVWEEAYRRSVGLSPVAFRSGRRGQA